MKHGCYWILLIALSIAGCPDKKKATEKPTASTTETQASQEQGLFCTDDTPCEGGTSCAQQPLGPCQDDGACPVNQECDAEKKQCIGQRCVNECTARTKRYRYNDRKLLQNNKVPASLSNWSWDSPCSAEGLCGLDQGSCKARSDADCKDSLACEWFGQCTAETGKCVASQEAECKKAHVCQHNGRCSLKDGTCIATSEEDCKKSTQCRMLGWCEVQKELCRVPKGQLPKGEAYGRKRKHNSPDGVSSASKKKKKKD